ncbi:MAG TPA: hypothetical protein VM681_05365 [Candidatus Thermoplasmatota archaeon]|nr:hypothetical protein [Candidatus Thermoplasmatota archaeon]
MPRETRKPRTGPAGRRAPEPRFDERAPDVKARMGRMPGRAGKPRVKRKPGMRSAFREDRGGQGEHGRKKTKQDFGKAFGGGTTRRGSVAGKS